MQAVFETFEHYSSNDHGRVSAFASGVRDWLGNIFGCPHKELSRPFSRQGETYRVCINCGARRRFDQQTWNSAGPFYFKPASTANLFEPRMNTVKCVKVN